MTNCNRRDGNAFEAELCKILADHGFWAHNFAQDKQGQPVDVIAVRNGIAHIIDCKLCKNNRFDLDRIESNQESSILKFEDCGNASGYFALKLNTGEIFMVSLFMIQNYAKDMKSLNEDDIRICGIPIEKWVRICE